MLPDLVTLALFARVAETGSISKAAEQSHLALAAASRRIALLESRYRVQLLYRSPRGVELTPAGSALLDHARRLLSQAQRLEADLSDYARGMKGQIRLQANTSAMTQFLPGDLAAFSTLYPDVRLDIEERRSSEIATAVREGAAEIGVIVDGTDTNGLVCLPYRSDHLVVVLPVDHPFQARRTPLAALLDEDFVGLDSSTALTSLLAQAAIDAGATLRLRIQVHSFEAMLRMVQSGLGIGVIPQEVIGASAKARRLRTVPLSDDWAERRMWLCVRAVASLPLLARRLLQHLSGDTAGAD